MRLGFSLLALYASVAALLVATGRTWVVQDVKSDVLGNVEGGVWGTINGLKWQFVETPKEKLQRLIKETGNQELLEAFNRVEDN